MGYDRMEAVLILMFVVIDLCVGAYVALNPHLPLWIQFALVFGVGTTVCHSATLGMHECSHNLVARTEVENMFWGMVANIPLFFPATARFKRYHMIHHTCPNNLIKDPDMPSQFEIDNILSHPVGRFVFLVLQPIFYGIRPCLAFPLVPDMHETINYVFQITFLLIWYILTGVRGILYLFAAVALMGLHPVSAHFVHEHAASAAPDMDNADETKVTFSYYGWWNPVMFNVGYHREHHDITKCPGSRLPQLRRLFPELYGAENTDKQYGLGGPFDGWFDAYVNFIIKPYERVQTQRTSQ
jgi:sphingolipid delta-4 desaturase